MSPFEDKSRGRAPLKIHFLGCSVRSTERSNRSVRPDTLGLRAPRDDTTRRTNEFLAVPANRSSTTTISPIQIRSAPAQGVSDDRCCSVEGHRTSPFRPGSNVADQASGVLPHAPEHGERQKSRPIHRKRLSMGIRRAESHTQRFVTQSIRRAN